MRWFSKLSKPLGFVVTTIVCAVGMSLAASPADQSVAVSSTPVELAPITITASPSPKSAWNTPASVTVTEGRQLDKQRGQSVMSAIQDQPGVNMIDEGPTVG